MTERLFLIHAVLFLQNGSDSHASVHGSLMRQLGCEVPARKLMPSWRLRSHHGPNLRHPELASSSSGPNTVDSGSACRRTASTVTALRALETFRGQNGISKQSICQQYIVRKTSCPVSGCALKKRRMPECYIRNVQVKIGRETAGQAWCPNWSLLCCWLGVGRIHPCCQQLWHCRQPKFVKQGLCMHMWES